MPSNDIITALIAAQDHGFDADLSVEDGLIRTGVDGLYRFFTDWGDAITDLTERVAKAVEARR
mgnify:CR=1 FL=1